MSVCDSPHKDRSKVHVWVCVFLHWGQERAAQIRLVTGVFPAVCRAFFGCLADLSTPLGQSDKSTARQEEEVLKESLKSVSNEEERD